MDSELSEIGHWIERPAGADALFAEWMATRPELATLRQRLASEDHAALHDVLAPLLQEMQEHYHTGLSQETGREIQGLLTGRAVREQKGQL